ncbi:MAG: hypothetical protein LBD76_09085, partial [Prevotellaceae bacterium]|nr:hypothetical protein [Prevotellaceae bacterium]
MCVIFFATVTVATAHQGLTAVNDTVRTGPRQIVTKNIIRNDTIPGDTYSWEFVSSTLPTAEKGTMTKSGDNVVFEPAPDYHGEFNVYYKLIGSGTESVGEIHVIVNEYNNPVNVIYPDEECVSPMPEGVNFSPYLKYIGKTSGKSDYHSDDKLDGFSMPLVGDLNGDHKPEIIAMGISSGDDLTGIGTDIIILNGQTGFEIYRYALSKLGGDYHLRYEPRHNSISKLAIADLDRNGIGDIIVTEVGSQGRVHCIEPVYNGTNIVSMTKKWTGWTGNTS